MARIQRTTGKIFGQTASPLGDDPEIGQFGSALAGTYVGTNDVNTIQSLPAWSKGFIGAVTPSNQYPPLPEMTGVCRVLSQQACYLLQQGLAEWDSGTTYYTNNFCSKDGNVYISNTNNNTNNDPETDKVNWRVFENGGRSHNLYDVVIKDHVLSYGETQGFSLQGDWAYKEAESGVHYGYPTFYNRCISERDEATLTQIVLNNSPINVYIHPNGHIYFDIANRSIVDAYFNTYGIAWYYGIDTTNERILMPRNSYFWRMATQNPGELNLPGAPSITHNHPFTGNSMSGSAGVTSSDSGGSGVLNISGARPTNYQQATVVSNNFGRFVNFSGTPSGTIGNNSTVNAIYGRQNNQIMATSANGILYICTGNTVDENAITINAALQDAIDALESQEQTSIGNISDAGDGVLDDISNAKNDAIQDIEDETSTVVSDATEQADRAEREADRAQQYADIVVAGQVQADWTQNDPDEVSYIRNKPVNVVTETGVQTLTNKTIDGSNNILQNLTTSTFGSSSIASEINNIDAASSTKFTTEYAVAYSLNTIQQQINDIQIAKNPNLSIIGDLTINSGNVTNFSATDYLQFPYVWNFGNYHWSLQIQFTTGSDVITQQNIINSYYGVAVAIINGKFVMSISSNATSWDIANGSTGTTTVEADTVYTVIISWDGSDYVLSYSLDGNTFTDDIIVTSNTVHSATQQYVGASPNLFGTGTAYPFAGSINLNLWKLTVNGLDVWFGMDDAGLASRANVSLTNLDDQGELRFSNLQNQINAKEDANITINILATSGTIALTDNTINAITPTGNVTFTLPTIANNSTYHQILIQVDLSMAVSFDLDTTLYFNGIAPDLSSTGYYNILYEYDKLQQAWVVGVVSKKAAV